jgi:heptose I phosphotransferase
MMFASLWRRMTRGVERSVRSERYQSMLPDDLETKVMAIESSDRYHAKQGRSTARVRFESGSGTLSVYLKRHYTLGWRDRVSTWLDPSEWRSPAGIERANLDRARALGIDVPDWVAAGERIVPGEPATSYLMIAELVGFEPLHEAIPKLEAELDAARFERVKRALAAEVAAISARLHAANFYHKDLYLCHFFLDMSTIDNKHLRISLIDLHRLERSSRPSRRGLAKDLGQLLFSTRGVAGIGDRDRLRFWSRYRKASGLRRPRGIARVVVWKAARYEAHNRKAERGTKT